MKAIIINGPNLNMLGKRDENNYGSFTLEEINNIIINEYEEISFFFYQSNHEGDLIDMLHKIDEYDFLLMNPGGLSHYSISLRDAFELVKIKKGICHLSNINDREDFRKIDLFKDLADVYIVGLKEKSYLKAIKELVNLKKGEKKND